MTMSSLSAMGLGVTSAQAFQDMQLDLDRPEKAISQLKSIRNSVIGSRTKKSNLVHTGMIEQLVLLLQTDLASSAHAAELIALAATIIASLANTPAHHTLLQLMRTGTQDALLFCLRNLIDHLHRSRRHILAPDALPFDALKVLESLLRALRSVLLSLADHLSASPRWGIGSSWGTKPVASGVSISRLSSAPGATKIFGKSQRDSNSSSPVPAQDVLMNSASSDNLRARAKRELEGDVEEQQKRELRLLSRAFLSKVYSPQNLSLLIGPLFICKVPQQPDSAFRHAPAATLRPSRFDSRATSTMGTPSPALRPADAKRAEESLSNSVIMTDADANADSDSHRTSVDLDSLSMTTKTKLLSIVEMISAVLTATLFIPGSSSSLDGHMHGSAADEIYQRRERVLDFSAADSPFAFDFYQSEINSTAQAEEESRGRRESDLLSRKASGIQAELIRKGSRSRSRMKESVHSATSDSGHLPMWEEDANEVEIQTSLPADAAAEPDTVLVTLLAAAECGYAKTQEAALFCLAELTRDNTEASMRLFRCYPPSGLLPTSMLLNLRRSTSANVRLAAFCCLANIIKVHPFTAKTNQCVLEVLMELLEHTPVGLSGSLGASQLQSQGQVEIQIQAAFAIARLVADNVELQTFAAESYNALSKLVSLLDKACNRSQAASVPKADKPASLALGSTTFPISLTDPTVGVAPPTVDESAIRLREASLTALSSLTFQEDDLRRKLLDAVQPPVLPLVVSSLQFPALGVRIAACRLTRALSRSISILRTSIVDAGVAQKLVALLTDAAEEEAVKIEATAAICNLVLDFSPMKKLVQELGGIDMLVRLARDGTNSSASLRRDDGDYSVLPTPALPPTSTPGSRSRNQATRHLSTGLGGSQQLRLHALWALKNLLSHSDASIKVDVMAKLGFPFVISLCETSAMCFREQALNILRNIAATKDSDVTFMVDGVGSGERLMMLLEKCIWDGREAGESGAAVIEQAAFVLVNLATGTDAHRRLILRSPNILDAIVFFCNHPWKDIRAAGARCIGNLLVRSKTAGGQVQEAADARIEGSAMAGSETFLDTFSEAKSRFIAFGIDRKIRDLAQNDTELDVKERAKFALNKLEASF